MINWCAFLATKCIMWLAHKRRIVISQGSPHINCHWRFNCSFIDRPLNANEVPLSMAHDISETMISGFTSNLWHLDNQNRRVFPMFAMSWLSLSHSRSGNALMPFIGTWATTEYSRILFCCCRMILPVESIWKTGMCGVFLWMLRCSSNCSWQNIETMNGCWEMV